MNLRDFSIKVQRMGTGFPRAANAHFRRCFLAVDQAVVISTPVDTGFARSNWRASVGGPASSTISPYSPGNRLGRGEGANAAGAMSQAKAVAAARQPGQTMYLTNNVNYIGKLNAGSSAQAGPNFVERGIVAGLASVRAGNIVEASVRA